MKNTITLIFLLCSTIPLMAQSETVNFTFNGFYKVIEGTNGDKYYSVLYDSTFYENENLIFIRVLNLGNRTDLAESLSPTQEYTVSIQRKLEYGAGCGHDLMRVRSNRAMTDVGTLFGSDFLLNQKNKAKESSCDYKAIEYYYILEIKNKKGG